MTRLHLRTLMLLCLMLLSQMTLEAQKTAPLLWPLEGLKTGEGILYRPQELIDKELNFDNLFLTAPEGTKVVCPADAVVIHIGLGYSESLNTAIGIPMKGGYDEALAKAKESLKGRVSSPLFICGQIGLKLSDGRKLYLSGLKPMRIFKTGSRVVRGEVLGTLRYSYHKISQPSLDISIATAQGKSADPMTPFGLKTTFRPPVIKKPKARLSRAEAAEDYRQLAHAIRELYPSLEDLMSLEEYDRFVADEIARLPREISLKDFASFISRYNSRIHDSHIYIDWSGGAKPQTPLVPALMPSKVGDKLLVLLASKGFEQYIGQEITHINGRSVAELMQRELEGMHHLYDAGVRAVLERHLFLKYFFTNGVSEVRKQTSAPVRFTLASGETVSAPMLKQDRNNPPYGESIYGYVRIWRANRHPAGFALKELSDTTAYLGLSTFDLDEVSRDSIVGFIRQMRDKKKPALIIDLRNNHGGSADIEILLEDELLSEERVTTEGYSMVNASTIKVPTLNLSPEAPMFEEYKPIEGRRGLYLYPEAKTTKPKTGAERAQPYTGRVYVLTDGESFSASTSFAGQMKLNRRAKIIGRETGSAYHCFTASKFADIELKHSRFLVHIPLVRLVFDEKLDDRFPRGRGVMPDIHIPLSVEEVHSTEDYILKRALEEVARDLASQEK